MHRSHHLRPLSHDHHVGLVTARRLRDDLQSETDLDTLQKFIIDLWENELKPHCSQEEEHLLPELNRLGATAMKDRLLADHRMLHALITSLREKDDPRPDLREISELLKRHIRFEERSLFPFLERQLGEKRLRRIGAHLQGQNEPSDND